MEELDKKSLRKRILAIRDNLDDKERERAALLLTEAICGHQWFYRSDTILGFVSYGSEIDTREILCEALQKGKKVYVPKVMGDEMLFYRITSLTELQEGYKGILEPAGDTECFVYEPDKADKLLLLMPGAVFDLQKNRIGYGKGFYDRFLADKQELQFRSIAVGYKCQLIDEVIPTGEWDIRPYQVICV